MYFIYIIIPRNIYDSKIKFLLSQQYDFRCKHVDKMYGLYAISDSKKLVEEFFDIRGNYGQYLLVDKKVDDKDMVKELKDIKSDLFLKKVVLTDSDGNDTEMVVTKNEYSIIEYDGSQYVAEFGPDAHATYDYKIFNDKIQKSLSKLNYTVAYDTLHCKDLNRMECADYNYGFYSDNSDEESRVGYSDLSTLIYLFNYMFLGSNEIKGEGDVS